VRGWVKGSIAVLVAALVCAVVAPASLAAGAEVRPPTEEIQLDLQPVGYFRVTADIKPLLGVAVIWTEEGPKEGARKGRPWGTVGYAARTAIGPTEGKLDVEFPGFGSIVGELVPRPNEGGGSAFLGCEGGGKSEGVEFRGSASFTGAGGSPTVVTDDARGRIERTSEIRCRRGGGERTSTGTGLFDYLEAPHQLFNADTATLSTEITSHGRVAGFEATHHPGGDRSTFRAQALEPLPGPVAIARVVEVTGVPGRAFEVSSKAEHPKSATVDPPAPFSGSAVYRSAGGIRSPAGGKLTGSLSVDLFGVKVRLAGPRAKASLLNVNPGF
jgi:hypothetical protein